MVALQLALIGIFLGLVSVGAVTDVSSRRIPNSVSLAAAAAYGVFALIGGADWRDGLLAGVLVFAVGFVLFARGLVGGGDVKLLTAASLWAGTDLLLPMIAVVAAAGGVVSAFIWVRAGGIDRLRARLYQLPATATERLYAPYALAILAGAVYVAGSRADALLELRAFLL